MTETDKRDEVVDAARAALPYIIVIDAYHEKYTALADALSALDETPEQRVVRCAKAWAMGRSRAGMTTTEYDLFEAQLGIRP